ncbi:MAG: GntR family transcriptional regulator [Hyphomicrobiales bacterium]|nr:GntR family transcriptional regulator [Hyphomicrobiales bacterium]
MKSDTVYKRAFNQALDIIVAGNWEEGPPSETVLGRDMGVSRTTVRKVLSRLGERHILAAAERGRRTILRRPQPDDYFPDAETTSRTQHVESRFMDWMLRGDTRPGTLINELELARQFSVATASIREFLIRFSRFGLIEKRPNSGWLFKGFTPAFALELFEIRVMFELRSARLFAMQPADSPLWVKLEALRADHLKLLREIETRYHDFSDLDSRFHQLISRAVPNRFIDEFYDVISLIFHYHYQWNKKDEKQRNEAAIEEHLAYMDGLESRDVTSVERACLHHLNSARETLLRSLMSHDEFGKSP